MKTDHQLALLVGAEKEGVAVHEGLRLPCNHLYTGTRQDSQNIRHCPKCKTSWSHPKDWPVPLGFTPNPDPMVLIAACHIKGWTVFSGPSEIGGKICVELDTKVYDEDSYSVHSHTFEAGLIDAVFQATEALELNNWLECYCGTVTLEPLSVDWCDPCRYWCYKDKDDHCPDCKVCYGTGWILNLEDDFPAPWREGDPPPPDASSLFLHDQSPSAEVPLV